jgi:Flp pilus assembly protein TadG
MQPSRKERKAGAALVESCLVIVMLCIILFGLLQVSYLVAARDVVSFSAFAACRSATVGMREEFVGRVARVTSIPTAGPMVNNAFVDHVNVNANSSAGNAWDTAMRASPSSDQYWVEKYNIPYYLGARYEEELTYWLNYYNWISSDTLITADTERSGGSVVVYVQQYVPLAFPFASGFYRENMGSMVRRDSEGTFRSEVPRAHIDVDLEFEDHSALYLTGP